MVYQGTVLSPPLWNIVYADAAIEMNMVRFLEIIFADDVNCIKNFGIYIYIYIYKTQRCLQRRVDAMTNCTNGGRHTK